jgi:hypothetical protein
MNTTNKFILLKATCLLTNLFFFLLASFVWINSQKAYGKSQLKTVIVKTEINEAIPENKQKEAHYEISFGK